MRLKKESLLIKIRFCVRIVLRKFINIKYTKKFVIINKSIMRTLEVNITTKIKVI